MAGIYSVKSGSYKVEHVKIFEIRYYYEYCTLNKEPKLKWFTYLAYLLAYDQIQGFVPWALELTTPGYAQKSGNKNYLPYICAIMETALTPLFKQNGGYLRTKDFAGNRQLFNYLKKQVLAGSVEKIKPGLYRDIHFPQKQDWEEVALIVPKGIFCLFSAWQIHELSTHVPSDFHLAVAHKAKVKLPDYPPIKLYHWTEPYLKTGVEIKKGYMIYDREKSVCDAIRHRNKVGMDVTSEVIKNYLKQKDRNLDKLLHYAGLLKAEEQLQQYLSVLL